ncbi:MAG: hypothetical protein ABI560_19575, partial [Myxococcales bacterium]
MRTALISDLHGNDVSLRAVPAHIAAAEHWDDPLRDCCCSSTDREPKDDARGARAFPDQRLSKSALSRDRSFRLARRIADAISGATTLEKPLGAPRFR